VTPVLIAPWLLGGVQPAVQIWFFLAIAGSFACWWLSRSREAAVARITVTAAVPLVVAMLLGSLQLLPLSRGTMEQLSSRGARFRGELTGTEKVQSPSKDQDTLAEKFGLMAVDQVQPVSLYPASTRRNLALLVLGVAVFFLGSRLFISPQAQLGLCILVAINGAALAFLGLVQNITPGEQFYEPLTVSSLGVPFASFVNRNNAAGYLNLCLAGTIGLLAWSASRSHETEPTHSSEYASGRLIVRSWRRLVAAVARLNGTTLTACGLAGCIAAAILCSLSRGGSVAMIVAALVTVLAIAVARRQSGRLGWCVLAAAMGSGIVFWVGMSGRVQASLETVFDQSGPSQNIRLAHWRDTLRAVPDFWLTGSGLGTYRYLYPVYEQAERDVWFYHAENQYLEALVETGVFGIGLILALIGLVALANWRLLRSADDGRTFALGVAGTFALSSQVVHAAFDFGLYLAANMMLFALLCGAVSAAAAQRIRVGSFSRILVLPGVRGLSTALSALLFAALLLSFIETQRVATVAKAMDDSDPIADQLEAATPQELQTAIAGLTAALDHRTDDAEVHYRTAKLWTQLYRLQTQELLRRRLTVDVTEDQLRLLASLEVFHAQAQYAARFPASQQLEQLRRSPPVSDNLTNALRHLVLARRSCPLLPHVHLTLAKICAAAVDPSEDRLHLQRTRELASSSPEVLFECGLLELQAGRFDLACASWRQSLSLSDRFLTRIVQLAQVDLNVSHLVAELFPDSPDLLIRVAREQFTGQDDANVRQALAERAAQLLRERNWPQGQHRYWQGAVYALQQRHAEAIASYSQAIKLRPENDAWRYELAVLLAEQGQFDEAREQAKWCARISPHNPQYHEFLKQLHQRTLRQQQG
jgi:O-antigen ligase/tetratricopeptide (TPR) repeat protein